MLKDVLLIIFAVLLGGSLLDAVFSDKHKEVVGILTAVVSTTLLVLVVASFWVGR